RRLEPLFEEETESDEEKTQQESEELKKGETTTNGHYLEDSEAGSSSEEEEAEDEGEEEEMEDHVNTADYEEEDEDLTSTEERLQPQLQTTILGPRPLTTTPVGQVNVLPPAVLKASSCEYLLDRPMISNEATTIMATTMATTAGSVTAAVEVATCSTKMMTTSTTTVTMMTATTTATAAMTTPAMETSTTMASTTRTTPNRVASSASTTISSANVTTASEKDVKTTMPAEPKNEVKIVPRPAKFIPPPPPPRRLLLTQTNLKTSGADTKTAAAKVPQPQRKSGGFADTGSSVGAKEGAAYDASPAIPTANIVGPQHTKITTTTTTTNTTTMKMTTATPKTTNVEDVIRNYSAKPTNRSMCDSMKPPTGQPQPQQPPEPQQRLSSTIIETSLLSLMDNSSSCKTNRTHCTSSTTASKMKGKCPMKPERKQVATTQTPTSRDLDQQLQMEMQRRPQDEPENDSTSTCAQPVVVGSALSPRLEMRLALNQDIMGDEDLISYDPGPDLTTILVHDLSTFHRLTGRDLLNRSAMNRVQPKEAVISYSQQRNSKMDTPTVNRRPRPHLNSSTNNGHAATNTTTCTGITAPSPTTTAAVSSMPFAGSVRVGDVQQHLQPNRNTWSSFAFADRNRDANASDANSKDDSKLSDLEILARREKIYCMSQLRSGSRVKTMTTTMMTSTKIKASTTTTATVSNSLNNPLMRTTSTTSMAGVSEEAGSSSKKSQSRQRKISRDETALMETGKANKLINFIKRRNSEIPPSANNSQTSLNDSNSSSTPQHAKQAPMSPRKDNDKPSLNRRLWKQITKRRRSNSVSELVAS
ncbi:mucin-2-like, partial [Musca vetustissima]|uniref:mucin-2-like n=1 Tax=Musca vetustissima TaxID=27455 RepID=UPI002AB7BD7B